MKYVSRIFNNRMNNYLFETLSLYGETKGKDAFNINRNSSAMQKINKAQSNPIDKVFNKIEAKLNPEETSAKAESNRSRIYAQTKNGKQKIKTRRGQYKKTQNQLKLENNVLYYDKKLFSEIINEDEGKKVSNFVRKEIISKKYKGSVYNYIKENIDYINTALLNEELNAN